MLIHLVPRFLTCPISGPHVQLIDLRIDSVGLLLRDRMDLATRRPMPNKHMAIGCSKRGRLARVGLLIDTLRPAQPFTVVYRWAVAAEQLIVHRVHYELLASRTPTRSSQTRWRPGRSGRWSISIRSRPSSSRGWKQRALCPATRSSTSG